MLSNSSSNTSHYKSDAFDKVIRDAIKAPDAKARAADYQQAEQIMDKDSTIVPVYYYVNTRLVKPYVGGYTGKDPLDKTLDKNFYIIKH
jgi:oligopeptide transport system substrate-binding protein